MKANYGFTCKMTAKPGMGDQLVKLLLTGLDEGNPGSTEWCVVYLMSRSASNPDVVTVQEGWTTEEDHHRIFGGAAAQAIVAIGGDRRHRATLAYAPGRLDAGRDAPEILPERTSQDPGGCRRRDHASPCARPPSSAMSLCLSSRRLSGEYLTSSTISQRPARSHRRSGHPQIHLAGPAGYR
jgi:quinol monooxygenase YgiN